MGKIKGFLKSRIQSLSKGDFTAEFSEHEYPPIDLDKGADGNRQDEALDPKYRALKEKLRKAAAKVGRTLAVLFL